MAKGKVTIEVEGSSQTFEFEDMRVDMSQDLYKFYDMGDFSAKDMAPDGTLRINITGTREIARKNFGELRSKYSICERCN
jgi:hypothetical protein